ncbi:MAG: hypothetical protein IJY65_05475 [Clostridia bacterium]|nr:hypothetical protein [Clostridia bacterium]
MTLKDSEKLSRLTRTFDRNYRITRMYAEYLERYPEVITEEMVNTLTEDDSITKKEALVALLSEIFALDFENPEDRVLIRDYLTPSVRILDAKKYINDPYYRNIKIESFKDGRWELRREAYLPYRGVIAGDMICTDDFADIPPLGFFTERFEFPAVLEDGNEWMTLTPVDLDTSEEAIAKARGKVVTFGLGLGYYAYMASAKPEVESVTVVEKSPDVIKLFSEKILPQIPWKAKIRIVNADAFEYAEHVMPQEGFDLAFVDTWRDASDGVPMYERMKSLEVLSQGTRFMYWIEGFLRSRLRSIKFEELYEKNEKNLCGAPESYDAIIDELKKI